MQICNRNVPPGYKNDPEIMTEILTDNCRRPCLITAGQLTDICQIIARSLPDDIVPNPHCLRNTINLLMTGFTEESFHIQKSLQNPCV